MRVFLPFPDCETPEATVMSVQAKAETGRSRGAGDSARETAGDRSTLALTIPRQHGAWSVLLVSVLLGVGALGAPGAPAMLLLLAVVSGFLARHSAGVLLRLGPGEEARRGVLAWTAAYLGLSLLSGGLVVVVYQRPLLLAFGALAAMMAGLSAVLERRRLDRTAWGEVANMLGLSLVVPTAAYATTGALSGLAVGLWALAALFFAASVFHVRYLVRSRAAGSASLVVRARAGALSGLYHLGAVLAAVGLGTAGLLPTLAFAALLPATLKALLAIACPRRGALSIRRLGFLELAHSLVFTALVIGCFRLPWLQG